MAGLSSMRVVCMVETFAGSLSAGLGEELSAGTGCGLGTGVSATIDDGAFRSVDEADCIASLGVTFVV
jgi:hypothetical protein